MKFKKKERNKKKERLGISTIIKAPLPVAISSRINPMLTIGAGTLLTSVLMLFITSLRATAPFFFLLGLAMTGFAIWQKRDVLKKGYDEYLFKVVDYTYIASAMTRLQHPTGMLLMLKDDGTSVEDNMYHVATSGKTRNMPPIDWLVKVYVPRDAEAVQYGDRKYFPIVYGYAIEGEDK